MVDERRTVFARTSQLLGIGCSIALLVALAPAPAHAQTAPDTGFNAERLRIALDSAGIIDTEWAAVPDHLTYEVGLWLDYEHNPLLVVDAQDGHRYGALLKHRLDGALMGSIGLFGFAQLGLEVPGVLYQSRDSDIPGATAQSLPSLSSTKLGDLRIQPKIQLLWAKTAFVDVAIIPSFTLPTAGSTDYAGEKGAAFAPEVAISKDLENGFRVATNLGVFLRRQEQYLNQTIGNELEARLGVGYRFQEANPDWIPLELDLGLSGATSAPHPFTNANQKELELRGEATYRISHLIQIFGGPGFGFGQGFATPQWRAFAGARFFFGEPTPAEPAPAPAHVEKIELPPPAAPAPEPKIEPAPAPAPPPAPAPAPEPVKVEPAPPPAAPSLAKLNNGKIEIIDAVAFETGKDIIATRSYGLLDSVSDVMKAHPEIKQFRVEGYTDSDGKPAANLELSRARAKAVVRYLIGKGVAADQLTFEGYGDTRPIADNKTQAGRAANRRVEFHVVDGSGDSSAKPEIKSSGSTSGTATKGQ